MKATFFHPSKTICFFILILQISFSLYGADDTTEPIEEPLVTPQKIKEPPKHRYQTAHVVVESQDILDDCVSDKICVEGLIYNEGTKPAYSTQLRIDVGGGTKYIKPRTSIRVSLVTPTLEAGDRQEFSIQIPRKIAYHANGEEKSIEVGKYNFQLVPVWKDEKPTVKPSRKTKKW